VSEWWESFFDAEYLRLWEGTEAPDKTARQVEGLWTLLGLTADSRVLDAPCGYGRISQALAQRGARVLGVDQSAALLTAAEGRRGDVSGERLRYLQADLRAPLDEGGFDGALNIFSSLGYGTEADDRAILCTLRAAVRPGGLVFVETNHRDRVVLHVSQCARPGWRLADGTLMVEEPRFDPIAGRVETLWSWSGPTGAGSKRASLRIYTATELVRLMESAGLRIRSVHDGCTADPFFAPDGEVANRLGVLAARE
jgi:D-alanine-D-alanine ligase